MSAILVPLPARPMEPDWWTTLRAHVWANRDDLGMRMQEALAGCAHSARVFQLTAETAPKVLDGLGRPKVVGVGPAGRKGPVVREEDLGDEEDMGEFSFSQEEVLDLACVLVWVAYRLSGDLVPSEPPPWGHVGLADIPWAGQLPGSTDSDPLEGLAWGDVSEGFFERGYSTYLPNILGAEADPLEGLNTDLQLILAVGSVRLDDPTAGYVLFLHITDALRILWEMQELLWLGRTVAGEAAWVAPA
jgi:hypothetical protein